MLIREQLSRTWHQTLRWVSILAEICQYVVNSIHYRLQSLTDATSHMMYSV